MKKIIIAILGIILLIVGIYFFSKNNGFDNRSQESLVLAETYDLSKEYLSLRYRTDNILINAREYADYASWDADMTQLIKDWENLVNESQKLEESAGQVAATTAINFNLVNSAQAYTAQQISNIYDKAPKFKGIATLAKHLGVDAKRAQIILDQAQGQISAGVFSEEGDAFENLENSAIVVKDGCKVAGFVGGVVLTGGAAGFAAAGTMTQVGVVVVGADLALEVTEDGAQIAFGDKNKVSSLVKDIRVVTEPIATIINITDVSGNLGSAYGKFESVMLGLEQFRDSIQEGKVVGIDLRTFEYHKPFQRIRQAKYPDTVSAAEMEMAEVEAWLQSLNQEYKAMTQEEVKEFLSDTPKETPTEQVAEQEQIVEEDIAENAQPAEEAQSAQETKASDTDQGSAGLAGYYSGSAILQHVEDDVEADESLAVTLQLNDSGTGTATVYGYSGDAVYAGNKVSFSVTMKEGGYVVNAKFSGKATSNGNQTVISGTLYTSMMGTTFATYSWSAQK